MKGSIRKRIWVSGVLVACTVVAIVAVLHAVDRGGRADAASPSPATALQTVATVAAVRRDLERRIVLSSELRPYRVVKLYAKVAGYLRDIGVDYGSRVAAGQTVATLELPEQAADLQRTQSALDLAKVDYDRLLSVQRQSPGLIPQVDIDKARADYEMARDQKNQAAVILSYSTISAPFAGVVTKRYVDPGALISQGTSSMAASPIVDVADDDRLRMVVETPETVVPYVRVGMPVTVHVPALGATLSEHVARFSYDVHEDTRTMHTEVDIPNGDLRLKPGMYASVTLDLQDVHDVLAVPAQAVDTQASPNVWVVAGDGTLRERSVTTGLQTANWTQIVAGLEPGARVVIGDRSALTLGAHVRPKPVAATTY